MTATKKKNEKKSLGSFFPTKVQWKGWSITDKLTAIGAYLGLLGIIISIILFIIPFHLNSDSPKQVIHSKGELVSLLKTRADKARNDLQRVDHKMRTNYAKKFYELHLKHINALETDKLIIAHEELRKIQALLEEVEKSYEGYAYSKSDNSNGRNGFESGVVYGPPPYMEAHYYVGDSSNGMKQIGWENQ